MENVAKGFEFVVISNHFTVIEKLFSNILNLLKLSEIKMANVMKQKKKTAC